MPISSSPSSPPSLRPICPPSTLCHLSGVTPLHNRYLSVTRSFHDENFLARLKVKWTIVDSLLAIALAMRFAVPGVNALTGQRRNGGDAGWGGRRADACASKIKQEDEVSLSQPTTLRRPELTRCFVQIFPPSIGRMDAASGWNHRKVRARSRCHCNDFSPLMTKQSFLQESIFKTLKLDRRIRFVKPKLKEFILHHEVLPAVAPGLEVKVDVEFYSARSINWGVTVKSSDVGHVPCSLQDSLKDEVVVMCETDKITIPLYAFPCRANVVFEGSCNFGQVYCTRAFYVAYNFAHKVAVGKTEIRYIELVNEGLKVNGEEISSLIDVLGKERFLLSPPALGPLIAHLLDAANIRRSAFELASTDGKGLLDSISFGSIYFEEKVGRHL
eukprot:759977-Hanusia_phi.AAC.9